MSAVEDSLETQARIGALRCEGGPHSPTGHLLRQLADEIERLRELLREMVDLAEYWILRESRNGMSEAEWKAWHSLGHGSNAMKKARAALKEGS